MEKKLKLNTLRNFTGRSGPLLLVILDGVGIGRQDDSNGVYLAKTPNLDKLMKSSLYTTLKAHGKAVGMPSDSDMGNSEVGHNTLGAGRIFPQGATLVNNAVINGEIFKGEVWKKLVQQIKQNDSTLHFIGLLSDGNVHSHINHLFAMLKQASEEGVRKARLHILLDGRDVYERSALEYIEKTENFLLEINKKYKTDFRIASGGGRMVTTMDRYNADWSVVKRGWDAHVLGKGKRFSSAKEAVETFYKDSSVTDQYLDAFVITEKGESVGTIKDGDAVVFFNFRGDRAIEISRAFEEKDFKEFDRERVPEMLYVGMIEYDGDLCIPKNFLVSPQKIDGAISNYMCAAKIPSFAISETQKYGHVTYFWNGNNSGYINDSIETYIEIPSDRLQFDKAPKMKAREITEKTIEFLASGDYKFGRVNFANGDMVGHTGKPEAIIEAMEVVDECLGKLIDTVNRLNGVTAIVADHGNSEEMYTIQDRKKIVSTAHSLNPVPFAIVDSKYSNEYKMADLRERGLSNVAATLLNLLGYEKPQDYDTSLIEFV
ncbi:MAG: 2,3-bisphosphoglycerate-independent phosphoglycerate mutase [Candidatus Pacebacteria bacterium]|nr:2,3-bisphosphoglycerate-independent phosphoglycerate mutase [Candidatus Paceibacterota bacterium]